MALGSQDKVMAMGITETWTHLLASFYQLPTPAWGQLHKEQPGYVVLPQLTHCKEKLCFSSKKAGKRTAKKRKVKHFLLYVQCSEKKKINEISNKGPGESAGRKTLQTITRNLNSARRRKKKKKTCSNSCFIAYFVSERTKRVCQGCGRRFTVMTGSRGKSGFFLWMTGKRHDRKKAFIFLGCFPLQSDIIAPG